MASIRIHFDGAIASQHRIALRGLGKSLIHLQSTVDRAYLDVKYQGVWKYAKLKSEDYPEIVFLTGMPAEGGYILDFISENTLSKQVVNRISRALRPAVERAMRGGEAETRKLIDQIALKKARLRNEPQSPLRYEDLINNPPEEVIRQFGDRSIVKEIDQVASLLRVRGEDDGSSIELQLNGDQSSSFTFNHSVSRNFHKIVSRRDLGDPIVYTIKVISLDTKNIKGKIFNPISKKEANITFENKTDLLKLKPSLGQEETVQVFAAPLIEYGAFDPQAGDIYFLDLVQDG
jgi:hypothetical protein